MSESKITKIITLFSNDEVVFVVTERVAKQFQLLRPTIEDPNSSPYFLLQQVTGPILEKVIEYCRKHVDEADASNTESAEEGSSTTLASSTISDEELSLRNWDEQFVDVNLATLCDLIRAADYLKIEGLLKVLCKKVADTIKGNSETENMEFLVKVVNPKKNC